MYNKIFKKLTLTIPAFLLLFLSACVKTHDGYLDLSKTSDFVILTGAGLGNFKASNVLVNTSSTDTIKKTITVDLASSTNNNGAVTVTLGLDANAIAAYNTANGTKFQAFPTNAYKLVSTQLTVPAGQHYATTTLEIYQNKLDPTVSYMLPVTITNGGGKNLSSNQNTIYYNVIGNPLAGPYVWDFIRYNSSDTTGTRNGSSFTGHDAAPVPSGPTSLVFPDSYLQTFVDASAGITLSFTNTNGVLSNFSVSWDQATIDNIAKGGFTVASAPKLVSYNIVGDATTHYAGSSFRTYMSLINSSGGTRTLIDNFVKK